MFAACEIPTLPKHRHHRVRLVTRLISREIPPDLSRNLLVVFSTFSEQRQLWFLWSGFFQSVVSQVCPLFFAFVCLLTREHPRFLYTLTCSCAQQYATFFWVSPVNHTSPSSRPCRSTQFLVHEVVQLISSSVCLHISY
jgi:hypothetical protein